jgi:hypothetical protein
LVSLLHPRRADDYTTWVELGSFDDVTLDN